MNIFDKLRKVIEPGDPPDIFIGSAEADLTYRGFHDTTDEARRARAWAEQQVAKQMIEQTDLEELTVSENT